MRLREWNWDKEAFEEVDYPDAPIAEFINWLRTTKAWHADPELVHRKVLYLNKGFSEHRQALVEARVATAKNVVQVQAEALARAEAEKRERRNAVNRENLKKARAAAARKRQAAQQEAHAQRIAKLLAPDGELPRDF